MYMPILSDVIFYILIRVGWLESHIDGFIRPFILLNSSGSHSINPSFHTSIHLRYFFFMSKSPKH